MTAPEVLSSSASRVEMVAGMSLLWWKSSTAEPAVMGYLRSKTMIWAEKAETTGTS